MEQINKYRSPIVLGLLILFLLLFAFFMLGLQPANQELKDQELQLSQLNEQNNLLESKIDERMADTSQEAEAAELLAQLPKGDNSEQLILDLRAIGSATGTRLKDIGFSVGEQNPIQVMTESSTVVYPTVKQLNMTAVVEGDYTGVNAWLLALQSLPRIVNVDSFTFQRSSAGGNGQGSSSIITANVSFTAYFEDAADTETENAPMAAGDPASTAYADN
ncbi:type 4a pilus biogenesis protein PilO [Paenibacillus sp. PK3_47]|uniref:type 4a pilus biogenesis protein PilO n=1 Tax=Paenibacillus sp. PK3_47 TaxID=2072642 RepID=UPI00201E2972|nr:type 4a pilus biogenesis protein PilO [Paenibacillus sp. PK3_47]